MKWYQLYFVLASIYAAPHMTPWLSVVIAGGYLILAGVVYFVEEKQ